MVSRILPRWATVALLLLGWTLLGCRAMRPLTYVVQQWLASPTPTFTPTPTPTFTPTPTPTATPTPTLTPTPTATPTPTPPPIPAGWQGFYGEGFFVAIPGGWKGKEASPEDAAALAELLANLEGPQAEMLQAYLSNGALKQAMRFLAIDPHPTTTGYTSNVVLTRENLLFAFTSAEICAQLENVYRQLGIQVVEKQCTLTINGLEAGYLDLRSSWTLKCGRSFTVRQRMYFFPQGEALWTLTGSTDEASWPTFEALLEQMAQTFTLLGTP